MSDFISWLGSTITAWWTFLCNTDVPGTNFKFATLTLFILVFDLGIMIVKLSLAGNTAGGGKDVANQIKKKG